MSSIPARSRNGYSRNASRIHVVAINEPEWVLVEDELDLAREHEIESLFTVANGYIGTRASLAEGTPLSAPATLIAGVFDTGPNGDVPELVVAPDWMQFRGSINGRPISHESDKVLEHRRVLDMRRGMLWRELRFEDPEGRTSRIHAFRLASLSDRHLLLQSVTFVPENYSGSLYLEVHLEPPRNWPNYTELLPETALPQDARLRASRILDLRTRRDVRVALATASQLRVCEDHAPHWRNLAGGRRGNGPWTVEMEMGKPYRLDRIVSVFTSRDVVRQTEAAARHLERASTAGIDKLVEDHVNAWEARWRVADIKILGDERAQQALRFACYHLISSANPDDEHVSIGARALTGPAYKGHVFWDTSIFMLPFFTFTDPRAARALLMYRYHTLPGARRKAASMGYRGALYAWESADTGDETTPPFAMMPDGEVLRILSGEQEHHISADIAYAVYQYWLATGDDDFMLRAGAEIILDTARFWASRGELGEDGYYHIRKVIGPDEYHEGVDDNAFTNAMAKWNLEQGVFTAQWLRDRRPQAWKRLSGALALNFDEVRGWADIAQRMYLPFDPETGLIEPFRGYFALEYLDLSEWPGMPPIDVYFGRKRVRHSQIVKQADVVMLICLLWDLFTPEQREKNFRYYLPRTAHGSSLSPAIHALVAARLGDHDTAMRLFRQAAEIDLANNMGNAAGGVHAAALGGLWQAAIFGFGGVRLSHGALRIKPNLPECWRQMSFSLHYQGQLVDVFMERDRVELAHQGRAPIQVAAADEPAAALTAGARRRWARGEAGWQEVSDERTD